MRGADGRDFERGAKRSWDERGEAAVAMQVLAAGETTHDNASVFLLFQAQQNGAEKNELVKRARQCKTRVRESEISVV
jgi:hypothetical protein